MKGQVAGIKRDLRQVKHRCTHVDGDTAICGEARFDDAFHGLHADHVFVRQPAVIHKAGKTARSIAALLDFGTVGIVDDIFEINARRRGGPHG